MTKKLTEEQKKNKTGRPTVMTPEVIGKLEEAFMLGCTDLEACLVAEISKDALYDYQLAHPEFTERKEKLKTNPVLIARRSVVCEMKEKGDLALKFLERKKKDEFGLKTEIDLGGQKDNPLTIDDLGKKEMALHIMKLLNDGVHNNEEK